MEAWETFHGVIFIMLLECGIVRQIPGNLKLVFSGMGYCNGRGS